ncbi:phage tail protein [Aquimarina sp. 2201CG14-23]|uniref:phage tail protein n=1 Tax=Aquimarina mycalae TaxID=3040073 RepID=UPI00247813CC|nr:tail fiber protein [Aquimarina sp. 2201CG14-23]MDH7445466.1 tail fiber protein [Aquimarina sp. 2201CG14-23]
MEPTIGEIRMFAGNFAPRAWALCEGQLLPINQNDALFSILGTTYGGDGRTTFALPDLRGRVPVSPGNGPGLSTYKQGQRGGVETVTLNTTQIPSHTHVVQANSASPVGRGEGSSTAAGTYWGDGDSYASAKNNTMAADAIAIGNTGGNLSHENRQPFLSIYYIICLQGVYPSRS